MGKKGLAFRRRDRCLILAILLALAGFLYWQGYILRAGLILVAIVVLTAGILCTVGIRTDLKDGFLDGYTRAKDDFDKEKKG